MTHWNSNMDEAPRDVDILAWNVVTGAYRTRFTDGEWPLRDWLDSDSFHYPVPTHWCGVYEVGPRPPNWPLPQPPIQGDEA